MSIQTYQLNVPQATLDDLHARLARTRWPDEIEGVGWDYGTNLHYMKEFVDYWLNQYDWHKQEAAINTFAQFQSEIDGERLHFIHERGRGPNPTPIILFHGWPDSICRYLKVIPMLTDPAKYGADPNDSFDVIVPSFYGSSKGAPVQQMLKHAAERYWHLMVEELGYQRFAAGGGDGGSPTSQCLAVAHPETIIGLHLTDIGYHMMRSEYSNLSEAEQQYMTRSQMVGFSEGAYAMMLGTKPLTFSYGLTDSPASWASLVIEKFRTWSDCDGDLEKVYTKDELLTNIMLFWVLGGINPRGYREEWVSPSLEPKQQIDVPVGFAHPPKDITPPPPRAFAERNFKNIQRWTVLARGGHFVAMEDPDALAREIRAFFHDLKAKN